MIQSGGDTNRRMDSYSGHGVLPDSQFNIGGRIKGEMKGTKMCELCEYASWIAYPLVILFVIISLTIGHRNKR